MSVQIRTTASTEHVHQNGYSITPVIHTKFTDWNDGLAVADKPENRRDDILLERPTMDMGNETKIGYDERRHTPPSESPVVKGKDLFERFRSHNRDTWWSYREDSTISKDVMIDFKAYLINAFASEVGLNPFLKQCALRRFMMLDLSRGTGRTEINGFLTCALVANEEAEKCGAEKVYHPQRSPTNNDYRFQRLEDALVDRFPKITESSLTKVYNKLSQGNPPTRNPARWKGVVKRKSEIPRQPSFVTKEFNPQTDTESQR